MGRTRRYGGNSRPTTSGGPGGKRSARSVGNGGLPDYRLLLAAMLSERKSREIARLQLGLKCDSWVMEGLAGHPRLLERTEIGGSVG